ncbi:MAG TPA: RNA ligase family protein [Bacteroidales bacterium]|nr:RNA ligase family protein [Bacteroidales bacterium]
MNDENLATIQRIYDVQPHSNADSLDVAKVLGWQVITKRGEFKENDLVVYIAIDAVLPERPEFEFLRNKNFRIRSIKLRGKESAGIVFPLSILPNFDYDLKGPIAEGTDVTKWIGVRKYEKPLPVQLSGMAYGILPGFIIMTDEDNLRSYPKALEEMWGRPYYITRKDDGCSGTFFLHGSEFGVCSRKIWLKPSDTNGFWRIARKYDLENILRKAFPNRSIAIQGEVCGPQIQQNRLGLKDLELHIFNIFDITERIYFDYEQMVKFCDEFDLPMVTLVNEGNAFGYNIDELVNLANELQYPTGGPAEGIVVRPKENFRSEVLEKFWSGKIINEKYKES